MTKFEAGKSKEYKIKAIEDNAICANKEKNYLPGLYYLVAWQSIFWERKYLRTIICSLVSKKADQFFWQKTFKKASSEFSTHQFYFANN